MPGIFKTDRPINITGVHKVHLQCDCNNGSVLNAVREPILNSFSLFSPSGHKIFKEPTIKLFKKINKSVLSHITFYLGYDDLRPVDFNRETISFTCQQKKIQKNK